MSRCIVNELFNKSTKVFNKSPELCNKWPKVFNKSLQINDNPYIVRVSPSFHFKKRKFVKGKSAEKKGIC